MASNSSSTRPRIRSCCARCSSGWGSRWSRAIAPRTSPCTARVRSTSSSTRKLSPSHRRSRARMDVWAGFYEKLFSFREIRYFDIEGERTGLLSRAMTSPCGKIRIPINESQDDKSQIEEYLREYHGEGIQHIALATEDIYRTVDVLREHGVAFQDTPDTYYENLAARVPGHRESLTELRSRRILIDGNP